MTRHSQREAERRSFESFIENYTVPHGKVEYSDKPDVLIRGERILGIEIANLHIEDGRNPESEQVQCIRRKEVIEIAETQYRKKGGRSIELSVDFDPNHPIVDVQRSSDALTAIALTISTEAQGHESYCAFEQSPEIRFLYHNGKEYVKAKWQSVQSYDIPNLQISRVKEQVASKSAKIRNYQKCDAYWLLLVVDFWQPSQDQYIDWPANERLGPTPFERVLLYKPAFKQVVEVPR